MLHPSQSAGKSLWELLGCAFSLHGEGACKSRQMEPISFTQLCLELFGCESEHAELLGFEF